jgi:hypothetical protein
MTRKELSKRITRLGKEESRLKKDTWSRIQKMVSKYFNTCHQFPNTPMIVFTRRKDNDLDGTWDNAKEYKVPYLDSDDDWDAQYIGFTEDGIIGGVYMAMVMNDPFGYTPKQLQGILKQVENMKFNNIVNFN